MTDATPSPTNADRVALVSGASRGIGRAIAVALGAAGHPVACGYASDAAAALETVAAVEATGGRAVAVHLDVRDATSTDAAFT
ncbi:MAG: SDR family NAD(P)-dependent oxidoreductase, partial [Actinomycetes bacterium]